MIRGEHADWAATNFNPIVKRIIEEEFESGRPIYILTELPQSGQGFLEPIGAWRHHIPRLKGVTSPCNGILCQKAESLSGTDGSKYRQDTRN